jgi:hypothetical protein
MATTETENTVGTRFRLCSALQYGILDVQDKSRSATLNDKVSRTCYSVLGQDFSAALGSVRLEERDYAAATYRGVNGQIAKGARIAG